MKSTHELLNSTNFCVIVPTYNNQKTLKKVLDSILDFTSNVIIVNDGSTDSTSEILNQYSQLTQIHHPKNLGKGRALRNGFRKALELNFEYAITIDSDGQHFAADIPIFIEAIQNEPNALLIGSRNMTQENVPKKSSFGNKFSNFWFKFETGIKLEDTQSGFRLYPLRLLPKRFYTNKFEFEIEVIVRAAWKGIVVKNIPIQVLYDPAERVSHFRPFRDFTRISILNTVKKKGFKKFFLEDILESNDSNFKKSAAIALGIFIGLSPFWGFQTILLFTFAAIFRLNKVIAYLTSNVSFPPFIPFIIYGSLKVGSFFVSSDAPLILDSSMTFDDIQKNAAQYIVGSLILATVSALSVGLISYLLLTAFSKKRIK
ncbi:glycosyltransferase [Flavobacterium sp. Root935]|nr:glycosyltransferase [Flavobacterium sp. Root935]